jgi:hypothetical protein
MTIKSMIEDQEDFHIRHMKKRFEELEEDRKRGRREVYMLVEELQQLLMELIGMHLRLDRCEKMLGDSSMLYFNKMIIPAAPESK